MNNAPPVPFAQGWAIFFNGEWIALISSCLKPILRKWLFFPRISVFLGKSLGRRFLKDLVFLT